jgi:flagellar hook assembly protein FlgD
MAISWKLARPARVGVAILDETGRVVRGGLAPSGTLAEGDHEVEWDGLAKNGKRVAGALTVRVVAIGDVGRSELRATVAVSKAAAARG